MKFKIILHSFILSAAIVLTSVNAVFASPVDNIRDALLRGGVPANQVSRAVEYMQRYEITDEQEAAIIGKINDAAAKMNGETNLDKVSPETRKAILQDIAEAMSYLGLKADYSTKSAEGATVVQVTDGEGTKVASGDTKSSREVLKNVDVTAIKEAVVEAKSFSQNTDSATFIPVSEGQMKDTGTNYGNLMVFGLALMLAASAFMIFDRKRLAYNREDKGVQGYEEYKI